MYVQVKEVVELVEALLARCHVEEGKEEPKSGYACTLMPQGNREIVVDFFNGYVS